MGPVCLVKNQKVFLKLYSRRGVSAYYGKKFVLYDPRSNTIEDVLINEIGDESNDFEDVRYVESCFTQFRREKVSLM